MILGCENLFSVALSRLKTSLEQRSRIYALAHAAGERLQEMRDPIKKNKNWDYAEFGEGAALPVDEAPVEWVGLCGLRTGP